MGATVMAKVHFVRELAQSPALLKMSVQLRGKGQDHRHQGDVIGKMIEIKKRKRSLKENGLKVVPDLEKGYVSHHPSLVPDQDPASVVDPDQEAIHQDEEVEDN